MEIITARTAFNSGLTRYFTGKVCSNGHISERMISNGCCVECLKARHKRSKQDIYEATKVWRLKNPKARTKESAIYRNKYPEKCLARVKAYRERNLDKVRERDRENARRMRAVNPEKEKERIIRFNLKKDKKKVEEAGRPKPNSCEICKESEFRIVFDHCHASGKFRGWICDRCNRVLGIVKDSPSLLKSLSIYLEKYYDKNNDQTEKSAP